MLDGHITKILGGCLVGILGSLSVMAEPVATKPLMVAQTSAAQQSSLAASSGPQPPAPLQAPQVPSPDLIAYQQEMLRLSTAIAQKITQIQAQQQKIDKALYPGSVPPLQVEKAQLQGDLERLQLAQQALEANKNANDMKQALQQAKH